MRPRNKKAKERAVKLVVTIIEKRIEPKIECKKKHLSKYYIHKNPKNKYYDTLYKIILYIEEILNDYRNTFSCVLEDYLTCVYSYYSRFNRTPAVYQLSPSIGNKIKFDEWIINFERDRDEKYWITEDSDYKEFDFENPEVEADILEV